MPISIQPPALRPELADQVPQFMIMERDVEVEFRPRMLAALQTRVDAEAERIEIPVCLACGMTMKRHDTRKTGWTARFGVVTAKVARYRCPGCGEEQRPLLDRLGVEAGQASGALARSLALLGTVVPYELAARLAWLLMGVHVNAMTVWRAAQRLGQAAASYEEELSRYHADDRSTAARPEEPAKAVVLAVDGCVLGMQVRSRRRRRKGEEKLPPLPAVKEGQFREVKTGVLLRPEERVETSPERRSVVRRILVSCLGSADDIFHRLYARLRESGWMTEETTVVIVGDGAEWIWNRAKLYVHRCEILDFWHALEHAWEFARLRYGVGSSEADRWVDKIAENLKAGQVQQVIARLKRLRPKTAELRQSLEALIHYYTANVTRMRYDEYLRLGYGIGSGSVESAHKQVVHARFRQAGMRWSEAGARRLLALRLLLLNGNWKLLDRLRMAAVR
jgi:hypothetical protein